MSDRRGGVLRSTDFPKFCSEESISMLGSQCTQFALPIAAAVSLGATPVQIGLLGAIEFAAGLTLELLAGVFLDRTRRRPVTVVAQATTAAGFATAPVAATAQVPERPQVAAVG